MSMLVTFFVVFVLLASLFAAAVTLAHMLRPGPEHPYRGRSYRRDDEPDGGDE